MATERAKLTARIPPSMTLVGASPEGLAAPPPLITETEPTRRAAARFAVSGNAIVTGGGGTLGFTAAEALLEHGLRGLVIFDLNPAEAEPKIARLQAEFPEATISLIVVSVTDAAAVQVAVAEAEALLGPIDIMLCFAGIVAAEHALDMTSESWRLVMDVNTTGAMICAQAAARAMVKGRRRGSIVLVASISAHTVNFPQPQIAYNASKAAVLSLKSSLAAEWAHHGIRVNSISPGYMDTILNEGAGLEMHRRTWLERNPMGRMGRPDELTGAVVLLASRAGSYMTGTDILVDGGQTLF